MRAFVPKDKLYPRLNVRITHLIKFQRENSFSHFPFCHFIFPKIWFYHSRLSFLCRKWYDELSIFPFVCDTNKSKRSYARWIRCTYRIPIRFAAHCWLVCSVWPHRKCTNAKYTFHPRIRVFRISDDAMSTAKCQLGETVAIFGLSIVAGGIYHTNRQNVRGAIDTTSWNLHWICSDKWSNVCGARCGRNERCRINSNKIPLHHLTFARESMVR